MRILRNDFARYNVGDDEAMDDLDQDDYGWKSLHTDVFRFPGHRALLCSILGVFEIFLMFHLGCCCNSQGIDVYSLTL